MIDLKCHYFFDFVIIFTHSSAPAISLGQKMARNIGMQTKTIIAAKKVRQNALDAQVFFLLDFCCSYCVPMKFTLSSQNVLQVPNVFPNMLPRATHFIPYSLA